MKPKAENPKVNDPGADPVSQDELRAAYKSINAARKKVTDLLKRFDAPKVRPVKRPKGYDPDTIDMFTELRETDKS